MEGTPDGHEHLPAAVPRQGGRRRPARPRQYLRQREAPRDPADGADLQLHLGLRRPVHDVQQLEVGRSQVGHDARPARARPREPVLGRGREPQHLRRRADDAERPARDGGDVPPSPAAHAQDRHQHHRPDAAARHPDAHPHRRVLRRERDPDQHPRVARRHRRRAQPGPRREERLRQGLRDDRRDAGARQDARQLPVRDRVDDLRDQPAGRREHPGVGAHEGARRRVQHAAFHRRDAAQQGARGDDRLPASAKRSSCASSSSIACRKNRC